MRRPTRRRAASAAYRMVAAALFALWVLSVVRLVLVPETRVLPMMASIGESISTTATEFTSPAAPAPGGMQPGHGMSGKCAMCSRGGRRCCCCLGRSSGAFVFSGVCDREVPMPRGVAVAKSLPAVTTPVRFALPTSGVRIVFGVGNAVMASRQPSPPFLPPRLS